MDIYELSYDGGSYIGKCPDYEQAMNAARGYAKTTGLSILVKDIDDKRTREIVVHPDGDITHLWNNEK